MVDEIKTTYLNKNPLISFYSRAKINLAIRIADLKTSDKILDFGCGEGWMKEKLRREGYDVVGYDITPEHTEIEDYTKVETTKIFTLDVFEHVSKEGIKKIIQNFKESNKKFSLIVSIPTENWISRKIRKLVGKSEVVEEHITKYKDILNILKENFKLKKKINFFSVSLILVFEYSRKNPDLPEK